MYLDKNKLRKNFEKINYVQDAFRIQKGNFKSTIAKTEAR